MARKKEKSRGKGKALPATTAKNKERRALTLMNHLEKARLRRKKREDGAGS